MNTKKIGQLSLLCFFLICCIGLNTVDAQRSRDSRKKRGSDVDEYFDESGNFASKLWYGGQFIFWLSNREFNIGLAPLIGYKVTDAISIGPALRYEYFLRKYDGGVKLNSHTFGGGLFGRAKVFREIFLHVQYEYTSFDAPITNGGFLLLDPDDSGKIWTEKANTDAFFIGAGYSSNGGGLFGYEIMILYDLFQPSDSEFLPISMRFGFNYNF